MIEHERLKLRLPFAYRREQRRLWQFINQFDRWRLEPGPHQVAVRTASRAGATEITCGRDAVATNQSARSTSSFLISGQLCPAFFRVIS